MVFTVPFTDSVTVIWSGPVSFGFLVVGENEGDSNNGVLEPVRTSKTKLRHILQDVRSAMTASHLYVAHPASSLELHVSAVQLFHSNLERAWVNQREKACDWTVKETWGTRCFGSRSALSQLYHNLGLCDSLLTHSVLYGKRNNDKLRCKSGKTYYWFVNETNVGTFQRSPCSTKQEVNHGTAIRQNQIISVPKCQNLEPNLRTTDRIAKRLVKLATNWVKFFSVEQKFPSKGFMAKQGMLKDTYKWKPRLHREGHLLYLCPMHWTLRKEAIPSSICMPCWRCYQTLRSSFFWRVALWNLNLQ